MNDGRPRFEADRREREKLAARFLEALRDGDVESLRNLLAADVQLIGDGGGKTPKWKQMIGPEQVARALATSVPPVLRIGAVVELHEVNGHPGALFRDRDGKVLLAMALDVLDGRIQTIRSVINPDKLRHIGPVGDARAVLREANHAR